MIRYEDGSSRPTKPHTSAVGVASASSSLSSRWPQREICVSHGLRARRARKLREAGPARERSALRLATKACHEWARHEACRAFAADTYDESSQVKTCFTSRQGCHACARRRYRALVKMPGKSAP